jgi:hypothetical protein
MSGSRRKPGPLGPFVEGYRAWLLGHGYSPSVVIRSLIALGHLGRWMAREALEVDQLTAAAVSAFLGEYRSIRGRLPTASVWPLLEYLRAEGAVPPEPRATASQLEQLVDEYCEWLRYERGLAPVTVRSSGRLARRFLAQRVSPGDPRGARGITAAEVTDFLMRECERVRPGSAGCFSYRLRSLLRYLAVRGVADPGLFGPFQRSSHGKCGCRDARRASSSRGRSSTIPLTSGDASTASSRVSIAATTMASCLCTTS